VAEQTPVTFLFTDIEGSTRLWEQEPDRMPLVMARHDAVSKSAVERNRGTIVKMTGDGVHAAFDRPLDALIATLEIQQQLSSADTAVGLPLPLRCGLHAGIDERRDGDFYGRAVNRAARIMSAAHGGQVLLSKAVAEQIDRNLPEGVSLRDLGTVRLDPTAELVHRPRTRACRDQGNARVEPAGDAAWDGRHRQITTVDAAGGRHLG
jgi:class 3 adenylate cyclase